MSDKPVALVTGANKGLGKETAKQLAARGYTVLLAARDPAKGEEAAAELRAGGGDVRFLKLDVTDDADRHHAADFIAGVFGRLDALVNNAGLLLDGGTAPSVVPLDLIRQTFETNFFALVAVTQALLPLVKRSPAGRVVNLSSQLGSLGLCEHVGPDFLLAAYNPSKAAVNMYTVLLARELAATAVKVNSAHPGWVKTDMGGEAAPMDIESGAKTSVWLATLPADGPSGAFFHANERLPW
jgi:NAD(P)-dependent dehydrogenase (short-subunit alcohol dehydrogenase family)